jgi:uncharacterized membrane protein YhaH (DUF805 family)
LAADSAFEVRGAAMKWLAFFGNFDGRISRKTFWLASIAVFVIQLLIAVIAAVTAAAMANEAAGDLAIDIVFFIFLYPQFVIAVKRGHDRNISTWVIGAAFILLALFDALRFAGWLRTNPDQNTFSTANLISFAFILIVGVISLALLVELGFRRGTTGPNRYGLDPLAKA